MQIEFQLKTPEEEVAAEEVAADGVGTLENPKETNKLNQNHPIFWETRKA